MKKVISDFLDKHSYEGYDKYVFRDDNLMRIVAELLLNYGLGKEIKVICEVYDS